VSSLYTPSVLRGEERWKGLVEIRLEDASADARDRVCASVWDLSARARTRRDMMVKSFYIAVATEARVVTVDGGCSWRMLEGC
jgi:hypothetical protein